MILDATFFIKKVYCVDKGFVIICVIFVDMEDLKNFSKSQGAAEADDLNHWDLNFWSERLCESKYDINEVKSLFLICIW